MAVAHHEPADDETADCQSESLLTPVAANRHHHNFSSPSSLGEDSKAAATAASCCPTTPSTPSTVTSFEQSTSGAHRNLPFGCLDAAVARSFLLEGPSGRLPAYLNEALEIIPRRLYWLSVPSQHKLRTTDSVYLFLDNHFVYEPFFADFGPLNLGMVYRFCQFLEKKVREIVKAENTESRTVLSDFLMKGFNSMAQNALHFLLLSVPLMWYPIYSATIIHCLCCDSVTMIGISWLC